MTININGRTLKVFFMSCAECAAESLMQPCEACPNGHAQFRGK